ncbi:MAG TPA: glycosyltransferase family 4 protein [Solirubrobacteraceae bacterium]|nr:glycosyltransferase family 4 protein [Solirubrobacteraceae bacterium]
MSERDKQRHTVERRHPYCLSPVRVHVVDPSSYTPPYDHALCDALAVADTEVVLFTSRFPYGPVAQPNGYVRHEFFYRAALGAPGGRVRMLSKLAQHVPDMLRYRHAARSADVVHFQWLAVQHLDGRLLPARRTADGRRRPLVLTAHDVLPREPRPGQLSAQKRLYDRFDAIVVHSEHGRERLIDELGADGERVHVIPHGVFTHLAPGISGERQAGMTGLDAEVGTSEKDDAPRARGGGPVFESAQAKAKRPTVLMFGLMRPYKGIDVLLDAWRGAAGEEPIEDAELLIAGMPRMDISGLRADAPANVSFDPHFVTDEELPAYFERADLVVLPYLQADQSGVLFTALAFGKPLLLSDVGGFPEIQSTGAARIVEAGDPRALGKALREMLADEAALTEMCVRARAAANGRYSWKAIAAAHIELYELLLGAGERR